MRKASGIETTRLMSVMGGILWVLVGLVGCAGTPTGFLERGGPGNASSLSLPFFNLSGEWEYEEGSVTYVLRLDHAGNGPYEWKNGYFETLTVSNGYWKGLWHQAGNDREGGFEAQFSEDGGSAKGRWWYTRIGDDHDPMQSGGNFVVTRRSGPI